MASGEYGDLNPMLFRAVQKGLCAMTEKKSSLEKNEVSTPCPPCRPVSRGEEGKECRVEEGRGDMRLALPKRLSLRGVTAIGY